jgi:ATP-dependent exoDNAse (exonuclease V) beta subunit
VIAGSWPVPGKKARAGSHMELLSAVRALPDPGVDGTADTPMGRFVWLARRTDSPPTPAKAVPAPSVELVNRARLDVEALVAARQAAEERMARPFGRTASAEAHAALEQVLADRQREKDEEGWRAPPGASGGRYATWVGAAVHWVFEALPLDRPADAALRDMEGALEAWVRWHVPAAGIPVVLAEARNVLVRFGASPLAGRWAAIARHVVGREVPLLMPPAGSDAVGYLSGQIDLLYRDPVEGDLVVVDYKTDHVTSDEELLVRAAVYASQCRTYSQGVREALDLDRWPRWELWFLRPGRVVLGCLDRDDLRLE